MMTTAASAAMSIAWYAAFPASPFRSAPQSWETRTVAPTLMPQDMLMTRKTMIWATPTAAMADAPSPPTRKMSTMPTDLWRKLERTTGMASENICFRMLVCIG